MSGAYKTLNKSDVQTLPYIANKLWSLTQFTYNSIGVRAFVGQNITSSFYSSSALLTTDSASGEVKYKGLLYNTVRQLYYNNYLSSSIFNNTSSFENFEQTTILSKVTSGSLSTSYNYEYNGPIKSFPTSSNSIIRVLSIPKNIFGSKLVPGTIQISGSDYNIVDDKEGNLLDISSSIVPVGNVIYSHGLVVLTNPSYSVIFPTASSDSFTLTPGQKSTGFNMVFKGEHIIYENEIKCHLSEDEFNYTLNPSISSDGSGSLYGYSTGSIFNPYVTTVGLYSEAGVLLAVGKMSKPVPIPRNSDLTLVVRYDT